MPNGAREGSNIYDLLQSIATVEDVPNLFKVDSQTQTFRFNYIEFNAAVDPDNSVDCSCTATMNSPKPDVTFSYDDTRFAEKGINFLGKLNVTHSDGQTFSIQIPGELTYDPAGWTKSQHASERVGTACFTAQIAVTLAQIAAFANGTSEKFLFEIQLATIPAIHKYHQRLQLHAWMFEQTLSALCWKQDAPTYGDFLLQKISNKEFSLNSDLRLHTIEYLESMLRYKAGEQSTLTAPQHYYSKIYAGTPEEQLKTLVGEEVYAKLPESFANLPTSVTDINPTRLSSAIGFELVPKPEQEQDDMVKECATIAERYKNAYLTHINSQPAKDDSTKTLKNLEEQYLQNEDPVRKTQQSILEELYAIRSCLSAPESTLQAELETLKVENSKLQYQVLHLKKHLG